MRPSLVPYRRLGAAALCCATVTLAAGCSTGHPARSRHVRASATPLPAHQAIELAAARARQIHSYAASLSMTLPGATGTSMSGTMRVRLEPALSEAHFTVAAAGHDVGITEIVKGTAVYLKVPALGKELGKPWVGLSFAQLKKVSGLSLGPMFQQGGTTSPFSQTQLILASKNVHEVRTQVIDGVTTTEYAGSYPATLALRMIPASLRATLKPEIRAMGLRTVRYQVWLDARHQPRQLIAREITSAGELTVRMNVTAINQPVRVTIPPARKVASLPTGIQGISGAGTTA